jgi:hypothetical protein
MRYDTIPTSKAAWKRLSERLWRTHTLQKMKLVLPNEWWFCNGGSKAYHKRSLENGKYRVLFSSEGSRVAKPFTEVATVVHSIPARVQNARF